MPDKNELVDCERYNRVFQQMVNFTHTIKAGVLEALTAEGLTIVPFPTDVPQWTSFGGYMPGREEHVHCDGEDLMVMQAYKILFTSPLSDPECFRKVAAFVKEKCVVQ